MDYPYSYWQPTVRPLLQWDSMPEKRAVLSYVGGIASVNNISNVMQKVVRARAGGLDSRETYVDLGQRYSALDDLTQIILM